ncbi:MAG: hypothetical protein RL038_852 [Actinomycetota bacterium]
MSQTEKPSIAIIGAGVSGLTAAYVLRDSHRVTIFESDNRPGGHAHTHDIAAKVGELKIDTGFIVHNDRTYPNLLRIFKELNIKTQVTEMSMSINCDECGLNYAGGRGAKGVLAQKRRLLDPRFIKMLIEVTRFHKSARALLDGNGDQNQTWGDFLVAGKYSDYFIQHFAIPLVSCVWSSGDEDSRAYPAKHLFEFLGHHGMLTIKNSPTWRTVVGGSRTYVNEILKLIPDVRLDAAVQAVARFDDRVEVSYASATGTRTERFDYAIIATHANVANKILQHPSDTEAAALAAVPYSTNQTWLHTDEAVMPAATEAKASWNYRMRSCNTKSEQVLVSYWMNRLMSLPGEENFMVTLNPTGWVDESKVLRQMVYEHPVFTHDAVAAAAVLRAAGGDRLAFAGAHLGWGFHEDGARSGVEAARKFGGQW